MKLASDAAKLWERGGRCVVMKRNDSSCVGRKPSDEMNLISLGCVVEIDKNIEGGERSKKTAPFSERCFDGVEIAASKMKDEATGILSGACEDPLS